MVRRYVFYFRLAMVALGAALYTSEFLDPRFRGTVKTTIELMASLPSVVLGFLAALVLAESLQREEKESATGPARQCLLQNRQLKDQRLARSGRGSDQHVLPGPGGPGRAERPLRDGAAVGREAGRPPELERLPRVVGELGAPEELRSSRLGIQAITRPGAAFRLPAHLR